jgi:hypothetical protein
LALAQERLGNLRYARQAFHRAAELAPDDPRYLFHLAHLWDLASPRSAVLSVLPAPEALESWLRRSSAGETADIRGVPSPEKLFDHARALRRAGLSEAASRAEAVAAEKGREPARAEQGTLEGGDKSSQTGLIKGTAESSRGRTVLRGATTSKEVGTWTEVMFANLPFSPRQRRAARRLAADGRAALRAAGLRRGADEDKALAAAAAWAIAAIDELPLGCAEVAASFRLSTERVRRTYERLRGLLGLTAKDPRYGHPRRALRT